MTRFNYYYNGLAITKESFIQSVPEDWENELDKFGEYNYGYYKAVLID